jgi:hypothetical protein
LSKNLALLRGITGFGEISATILLAELPNIAEFTPKALAAFVQRMIAAGKPPKVILIAVARKLLVYAHAVIRTQKPFTSFPGAPSPA